MDNGGGEEDPFADIDVEDGADVDMDLGVDDAANGTETDTVNSDAKAIQEETGTLAQSIRETSDDVIDSKLIKYVLNSILSAFDMSKLTPEDKKDIINNFNSGGGNEETPEEPELNEVAPTNEELVDVGIATMDVPESGLDESKLIDSFISEVSRYDKGLASKLSPFAKRRALRKKLDEVNAEIKRVKNENINNFNSLEEED